MVEDATIVRNPFKDGSIAWGDFLSWIDEVMKVVADKSGSSSIFFSDLEGDQIVIRSLNYEPEHTTIDFMLDVWEEQLVNQLELYDLVRNKCPSGALAGTTEGQEER